MIDIYTTELHNRSRDPQDLMLAQVLVVDNLWLSKDIRSLDLRSIDKTSQGTKRPKGQNIPRIKRPKRRNVPRDKASDTNYKVFNKKFCVRKLATYRYVRKWASSVHSIYDYWGIPIMGRLS